MNRWQRYWFAPGGRVAAAVVRIAIATSVLWTVWRMTSQGYAADPELAPSALYRPVGILMLLGGSPPPPWLIEALSWGAWGATFAMLLGLRTRLATVVSWSCAVALACYAASFTATWSHHNNLPFLAQLAFFGARGGDVWSVDAWLRRRRGAGTVELEGISHGYQWSLRLVQLAVALMFFSAALSKIYFSGWGLGWALSDNLRHQLLARFDWIGVPRPAMADWLIDDVWRYRLAACGNLVAQLAPIAAVFLVDRPRLRALAGLLFLVEVLALGVVMRLWNLPWLPLAAVFIDWDRLGQWLGRKGAPGEAALAVRDGAGAPAVRDGAPVLPPHATTIGVFIAVFVLYDLAVIGGLDQRLRTYPFSAYPMFGYTRAKQPHDRHQTYEMPGAAFEVLAAQPLPEPTQRWLERHHTYRGLYRVRTAAQLRLSLEAMVQALQRREPERGVRGVRLSFAAFQAPAYPAPAALTRVPLALLGELRDGVLTSALGTVKADPQRAELLITPRWTGRAAPTTVAYELVVDYGTERRPLAVTPVAGSDGLTVRARRPAGGALLVIAVADDTRYVVGELGRRRW